MGFQTIKIIHNIINRADYVFLSEFFRMIGVFVCEEIIFDKRIRSKEELATQFDSLVFVGRRNISINDISIPLSSITDTVEYNTLINSLSSSTIFFDNFIDTVNSGTEKYDITYTVFKRFLNTEENRRYRENLKTVISDLLSEILLNTCEKPERDGFQFSKLIDVYVDYDIMLNSVNLQYFPKCSGEEGLNIYKDAQKQLIEAVDIINANYDSHEINADCYYYNYALAWLKTRVNLTCAALNESFYYPVDLLAQEIMNICKKFPNYSNARVLLGLCYNPAPNRINEALNAYKASLDSIGDTCFASAVHYWIGKRFEIDGRGLEQMKTHYELANNLKVKFRNIFKLAIIARNEKDYRKSISLFNQIIDILSTKAAVGFTDPLEIEYLFKSHAQLCYIYFIMREYDMVSIHGNKAKKLIETDIDENKYIDILYDCIGDSKETLKYKQLMKNKLNPTAVNEFLKRSGTI